ncbi:MAG: ABC transporter substrate-binding protein [Burkholderiaceae bacterium]
MTHSKRAAVVAIIVATLTLLTGTPESAAAKTLRWATRGDVQTMDPYSQNELLTNNFANLIHDALVERGRDSVIGPRLATSWRIVDETTWRFNLRRGVRFHDGSPFTADDVVFSIERAKTPPSQLAQYAKALGKVVKIDDYTIELQQDKPNPLLLQHLNTIYIMSRTWAVAHKAEKPLDFKAKEETYASRNANGTGPYILKTREIGVKTVLVRNPDWWGPKEGNVDELVYTPIGSDATRMAALLSGEIDFVSDPAPQDIARFSGNSGFRVLSGLENRVVFFGFDQFRDALDGSNITDRNPFKDRRVREAFYKAIDVDALQAKIMRGQSVATGCMTTAPVGCLDPSLEKHPPVDVAGAKKLMVEAGYPNGFEVTLDCPNDRYINDRDLCIAAVGMLARIGVTLRVNAIPKAIYFPKLEKHETSMYMLGWGGSITDAQIIMDPILHTLDLVSQKGAYNYGRFSDPELDRLIDAAAIEMDPAKRRQLIIDAIARQTSEYRHIVLHRQKIAWIAKKNVTPILLPSNIVRMEWFRVD